MFVIVDQNEDIDRNKIRKRKDGSGIKEKKTLANTRAMQRMRRVFPNMEIAELVCGDINVILDDGKLLAIERKRPGDFLSGIGSGRIFRQAENMAKNATWNCFIIEGYFTFNHEDKTVIPVYSKDDTMVTGQEVTKWRGVSVRGAMFAIGFSGCPIFMTHPLNVPQMVADIASFCSKPAEHTQSLGRKRIVSFPPITLPEEIISALPGVGLKRARALLEFTQKKNVNDERVPSLGEALSWASMLNLIDKGSRPEGWGGKTILNVRAALGLEMGEYLSVQENKKQVKERQELERRYKNEQSKQSKPVRSKSRK